MKIWWFSTLYEFQKRFTMKIWKNFPFFRDISAQIFLLWLDTIPNWCLFVAIDTRQVFESTGIIPRLIPFLEIGSPIGRFFRKSTISLFMTSHSLRTGLNNLLNVNVLNKLLLWAIKRNIGFIPFLRWPKQTRKVEIF